MAYAKLDRNNSNLQTVGQGMAGYSSTVGGGGAPGGAGQKSTAGTPSAFTNIQDYLKGNQGANATQNYVANKTDEQMNNAQNQLVSVKSGLPDINKSPAFSSTQFEDYLKNNNYDSLRDAGTFKSYTDTNSELPDIANPSANLKDTESIMGYIGSIKPVSQQYTPGMQKFDEMLLRGDPSFVPNFVQSKQNQYQTNITQPLQQARDERNQQKTTQNQNVNDWRANMSNYLGAKEPQLPELFSATTVPGQASLAGETLKDVNAIRDILGMPALPRSMFPSGSATSNGNIGEQIDQLNKTFKTGGISII